MLVLVLALMTAQSPHLQTPSVWISTLSSRGSGSHSHQNLPDPDLNLPDVRRIAPRRLLPRLPPLRRYAIHNSLRLSLCGTDPVSLCVLMGRALSNACYRRNRECGRCPRSLDSSLTPRAECIFSQCFFTAGRCRKVVLLHASLDLRLLA